ncbi:two-CW domain-containing protein [Psychromonas ossibalaenae]|uniref:two-CW domain-containing protein n=1 Tax=Psychromonas ossibalaenae TaxID=444922 RepID=UPI000382CBD0|nr:hypothetical protein [Psychromonas ossibalaenae]
MKEKLKNCWEIMDCGREKGCSKVSELGECIVSKEKLGHSCWAVAGTLCGGEIQGTFAQKDNYCTGCQVHKLYSRSLGEKGQQVTKCFPEEEIKYNNLLLIPTVDKDK